MKKKEIPLASSSSFVTTIEISLSKKMIADLENQGFELTQPAHTLFSAKKTGVSCTLYKSGKLLVQGKEMRAFIEFYLEPHILKAVTYTYAHTLALENVNTQPRIGIDESGKGDFFGPLCVAGVYAEGEAIGKLKELGVRDSKLLNDRDILKIGDRIQQAFTYHIVKINPAKYNELIAQFGNLNHLLAWGHATTIEQMVEKTDCKNVIVDQFAHEKVVLTALKRKSLVVKLTQRHRAEEDLVVAAASILARQAFILALKKFESTYGQSFPKGASKQVIAAGRLFMTTHSKEELGQVGKLHFKTLDSILR
jgi:ribonuclease HIII